MSSSALARRRPREMMLKLLPAGDAFSGGRDRAAQYPAGAGVASTLTARWRGAIGPRLLPVFRVCLQEK
ncbi:hypothetical protein KCP69_11775 [Salmonella enterica subsp. enterica]|nr:hypothetical protein KCP69_11775 [Salmonella enterica subsp. enterica]